MKYQGISIWERPFEKRVTDGIREELRNIVVYWGFLMGTRELSK